MRQNVSVDVSVDMEAMEEAAEGALRRVARLLCMYKYKKQNARHCRVHVHCTLSKDTVALLLLLRLADAGILGSWRHA